MTNPRDPHEIDLGVLFPSLPADCRERMRDYLDEYCEIALEVFERMEREQREGIDPMQKSS